MKYRPYIVSGPHAAEVIKALMDGSKTQFREPMKPQPSIYKQHPEVVPNFNDYLFKGAKLNVTVSDLPDESPRGKIGDRLYIKEAWGVFPDWENHAGMLSEFYKADGENISWTWRSPVTMPRSFSRITLEITGIRVERLNEISELDARREGVKSSTPCGGCGENWSPCIGCGHPFNQTAQEAFRLRWESQHGPGSFDNRWCWVYDVKRVEV